jgi:trimethylamine--corrinoid protein Co-methyltransferase
MFFRKKERDLRPRIRFLEDSLTERIVSEAIELISKLGVEINNKKVVTLLGDHGARVDTGRNRVFYNQNLVEKSLQTAPGSFTLYDTQGEEKIELSGLNVHFTPGSAAINILDGESGKIRRPTTGDYIAYSRLVSRMDNIASQSTALVPSDVHELVSDSYRLYLSLLHCEKPVVTGTFTIESFEVMKDLQLAVRGSKEELAAKPLTVFSCCPTAPMKWSHVTSQNLLDCAEFSIPVEYISMPLSGFMAPVTLVGTLVQHTAETLSGLVISQLARPGTPLLYGGSPAVFDIRYETTPMGAIGTMMLDCAYNEIGKYLGLPTQAYIGLSDSKMLDAQAGLESSMGATLAALAGINNISGPGMLDFESCFSLEKLVVDNEICGMAFRMLEGIEPKDDFPAIPRFEELLNEKHLLISDHTRRYLREEIHFPGPVIDRANRSRWKEEGELSLKKRARIEVEKHIGQYETVRMESDVIKELTRLMKAEARRVGMDKLPQVKA